jgi:hypothetical protein
VTLLEVDRILLEKALGPVCVLGPIQVQRRLGGRIRLVHRRSGLHLGPEASGAARRACSGRYPLRLRSSMARATAFGVMPTPSSSLASTGLRRRPPPSMTSVRGSAPGRQIGVGLRASTCKSIEVLILY